MTENEEREQRFSHLLASRPHKEGKAAAGAMAVSVLAHVAIVGALVWATAAIGHEAAAEEKITLIHLPTEATPPPPPVPPPPPETEPTPTPEMKEAPKGFQTLVAPEVIPPDIPEPRQNAEFDASDFTGEGVKGGRGDGEARQGESDLAKAPRYTPYTLRPRLVNRTEVGQALKRAYPPILKDAGIGGTVLMWFFIDEEGRVVKTQVKESSGNKALDAAAVDVAQQMRFTPAYNMDVKVKVWVSIPIVFKVN